MANTIITGQNRDTTLVKQIASDAAEIKSIAQQYSNTRPPRYGFRIKADEPDPNTRVQYIYDAVGLTPAKTTGTSFNIGDWGDKWFVKGNYPVMLNKNGTEAYRLDPNDYSKKLDGSASEVSTSTTADAMSAIPRCWVKRYQEGNFQYFIVSPEQYDETYHAFAHTRADGTIASYAYGPIYEGSLDADNKTLRSLSGKAPMNTHDATFEMTGATTGRSGGTWSIWTWSLRSLVQDLIVLITKSTYSQTVLGQGHTTGGTGATSLLQTGTLDKMGQFYGNVSPDATTSTNTTGMKAFHMENFWGDRWERLAGLIYSGGTFLAKMTPENGGYNFIGTGYESTGIHITGAAATGSGWQKETVCTEFGTLPKGQLTGIETQYETDFCWYNNSIIAVCLAGGDCNNGALCGVRCLHANNLASWANWDFGASLNFV